MLIRLALIAIMAFRGSAVAQSILDGIPPATAAERGQVSRLCGRLPPDTHGARLLGCSRYNADQDPRKTALSIANACSTALQLAGRPDRRAAAMREHDRTVSDPRHGYSQREIAATQAQGDAYRAIVQQLNCEARYGVAASTRTPPPPPSGPLIDRTPDGGLCNGTIVSFRVQGFGPRGRVVLRAETSGEGAWVQVIDAGPGRLDVVPWEAWIEQNCPTLSRPPPHGLLRSMDDWIRGTGAASVLPARCRIRGGVSMPCTDWGAVKKRGGAGARG